MGKSSIINALRLVAMDPAQRNRLARFAKAMATEFDWRLEDDANAEDEQSSIRSETAANKSAVVLGIDCCAAGLSDRSTEGLGDRPERRQDSHGDERGANTCRGKPEVRDMAKAQVTWQRRSDDIYGAQVCSLRMNMTGRHEQKRNA